MALSDYVSVAISATGPAPSAPGFGTGLAAAYHVVGGTRRVMGPYTSLSGVAADFGNVSLGGDAQYAKKAPYLMAQTYFAQAPKPQLLYIGRRSDIFTQLNTLTPVSLVPGTVYQFAIGATGSVGGVSVTYTIPANNSGSAASISYSGGVNTFTGLTGMAASDVGKTFVVSASTHAGNNGTFTIASYISATSITVANASGVTDAGAAVSWSSQPSLASTCTALAALLNTATVGAGPVNGFVADGSSGTHVLCTQATAGKLVEFQCQVPSGIARITESTLNPTDTGGVAGDLTAIWAENKAWYGLGLDSPGAQEGEAAAAWVESNGSVIMALSSSDSDVADSTVTNDLFSTLKSNSYTRTAGLFTQYSNLSYGAFGWLATRLTQTPGSDTWDSNTIAGVQADSDLLVPEASVLAVQAKNGSVYTTLANLNLTQGGTSGGGEWMDQTRFIDWLRVNIQLAMIALKARNVGKIPYDDFGIAMIASALRTVLLQGVANGGFVPGSIVITPPSVADIPTTSVSARVLPSLPWSAQLAGAIHRMSIQGTTSVA